jgi:hypothetical protein
MQHCCGRRVRQRDAEQQDQEGTKLGHCASVA